MAITCLPPNLVDASLTCAICSVKLTLDKATAGFLDCNGHQIFACVSHFSEIEKLITGWADFLAQERFKYLRKGHSPEDLLYGTGR